MRLSAFHVQHFRNVLDSTPIPVEPGITCLVGENESGKTALLEALWRANPHEDADFDAHEHYPRWLLTQHRKDGLVADMAPISVTFELDEADVAAVAELLGPGVLTGSTFVYTVPYEGASVAWLDVDARRAVANLLGDLGLSDATRAALASCDDFDALAARVEEQVDAWSGRPRRAARGGPAVQTGPVAASRPEQAEPEAGGGGATEATADAAGAHAPAADAGAPDAATPDAGAPDAATPDADGSAAAETAAGTLEAGGSDADAPEARSPAAGASDAGTGETTTLPDLDELRRVQAAIPAVSAWQQAVSVLQQRMPVFFYFSDYQVLPGRVALDELGMAHEQPGATGLQTARALLALAGTSAAALGGEAYEERKAELEAVSNDLTRQVHAYWRQNEDLSVDIDIDQVAEKPGARQGLLRPTVARYLDVRVKDHRHGFTNNFSQRSSGFQAFFSFLVAFSEFESREQDFVVLLDEPAHTLHGRAQVDFLRFIEERLAPRGQVVYTTHSPFMVDVDRLERVRLVEDKGPQVGATASTDLLSVQPETLFPVQAALANDIAARVFSGEAALVVETVADATYLAVLSDHLHGLRREGLAPEWRITPTGGTTGMSAFVALMGRARDVTVVVDSATHGLTRFERLVSEGLLDAQRFVPVARLLGRTSADVEDLFAARDYLLLYNAEFGTRHKVDDLPPGERILERIAAAEGAAVGQPGRPADHLLRRRGRLLRRLSSTTLDRFEALFAEVNATLEEPDGSGRTSG